MVKNIHIVLEDELHKKIRIKAMKQGLLLKQYLKKVLEKEAIE
jgi:predicted DNA binding CopG/RHH family protein